MVSNKNVFLAAVHELSPPSRRHSVQVRPALASIKYKLFQNHLELEQSHIRIQQCWFCLVGIHHPNSFMHLGDIGSLSAQI